MVTLGLSCSAAAEPSAAPPPIEDLVEVRSEHFVLRHAPGADQVMAARALEVLEGAYEQVGADLGLTPSEPVVVEIHPTSAAFVEATDLPVSAAANGTVGLCRFDRIFITSPAASPFGFPWADTLCHEYTHLLVERLGGGRVPVWLHEGIASFEQRRWRGETDLRLEPYAGRALAEALESDDLVTLDEIGDCLACLESPRRVALAFAQVHTMVDHLVRARGIEALRRVLEACSLGAVARDAIGAQWDGSFDAFLESWEAAVRGRQYHPAAGLVELTLDTDVEEATDSLLFGTAAGHARLGDLLLLRGRTQGALLEYRQAEEALTEVSPSLACKQAHSLQQLDRSDEAIDLLAQALDLYPDFAPLHIHLASARIREGLGDQALESLDEATLINPFDPRIYVWQLQLLDPDGEQADRARTHLATLKENQR